MTTAFEAPIPGLFITGTDTDVGKTSVAVGILRSLLARNLRVGAIKPVASGFDPAIGYSADTLALLEALGGPCPADRITPLSFPLPLAPCVAARLAGTRLSHAEILDRTADAIAWWSQLADVLVVEGVGGLLCPLAEDSTVADLAMALDYPLVIVARRGLGTLNHTLLTVEAARLRGLRIAGLVLNATGPATEDLAEQTNPDELSRRLAGIPILLNLAFEPGHDTRYNAIHGVDWYERSRPPRLGLSSDWRPGLRQAD